MHEPIDFPDLIPPGTYLEEIRHPSGDRSKKMEMAIFKEHRFSFYFWNRWHKIATENKRPPDLITIDWHRDMAPPSDSEKEGLTNLNLSNLAEVAKFTWSGLDVHNDSHLLAAAFLNLIGDVYLLKNYGTYQESSYIDNFSNTHHIYEYHVQDDFLEATLTKDFTQVLLDIDLDFFIKNKVEAHQMQEVEVSTDQEITEFMQLHSDLFHHLFPKLRGITIATEPRYCGGILQSNRILEAFLNCWFSSGLQWKHLRD